MIIGVPREIKNNENRVGLTDAGVARLVSEGHMVLVESGAGLGSGLDDRDYSESGASIVGRDEVYDDAEMIIKVKEPQPDEATLMHEGQILFAYLHLAAEPHLAHILLGRKIKAVAYETITAADGSLPLLMPMSEVAGRMAVQVAAKYLQRDHGGKGILLGGGTGVPRGKVTIIGGGIVGFNAAKIAVGLGADVTIIDINRTRLEHLDNIFGGRVQTLDSTPNHIRTAVWQSDVLIGAVLIPGSRAPVLVPESLVKAMEPGSVVVDVAVDQGGCIETCHPTSHENPTFEVDGIIHYCVPNMPGVVPETSTQALTGATLGYASLIARNGLEAAVAGNASLRQGVNLYNGHVVYKPVAEALQLPYLYQTDWFR
jgi:alanine dehydrogenase